MGGPFQGSQAEISAAWRSHVFSVWLSGLITTQSIRLAAASPQLARQSQAAGCGVFPLDWSYAAWLIPSRPQESPGAGKAFRSWQECREGIWDFVLLPYFLSETVGLEVPSRSICLGFLDTGSLWSPASQPTALPQRGRNEGILAWAHSPAISRTFSRCSSHGYIFGGRCNCLEIIRVEAPIFSETLEQTQASHPALPRHFSLHFWRN